jgi:hypothetical protein
MESEQSFNIPLDSPLDINSNDMLVPATAPRFSFNRQRYLGSLLQTSVRYEYDGWAAGWWAHNFDLASNREDIVEPPLNNNDDLLVMGRVAEEGFTYYTVQHKDIQLTYTLVLDQWERWVNGSGTVTRTDDTTVLVNGQTRLGDTFTVSLNPYTGDYSSFSASNPALFAVSSKTGSILKLAVDRNLEIVESDFLHLRIGQNITFNSSNMTYTRDATTSNWENLFYMNESAVLSVPSDGEFEIVQQTPEAVNTLDEVVHGIVRDVTENIIRHMFEYTEKWFGLAFTNVAPLGKTINSAADVASNMHLSEIMSVKSGQRISDNETIYSYMLPIWLMHGIDFRYGFELKPTPEPVNRQTTWILTFEEEMKLLGFGAQEHLIRQSDQYTYSAWNFLTDQTVEHLTPDDTTWGVYFISSDDHESKYSSWDTRRYTRLDIQLGYLATRILPHALWDPFSLVEDWSYNPIKRLPTGDALIGATMNRDFAIIPSYIGRNWEKLYGAITVPTDADINAIPDFNWYPSEGDWQQVALANQLMLPGTANPGHWAIVSNPYYQPYYAAFTAGNPPGWSVRNDYDPRPTAPVFTWISQESYDRSISKVGTYDLVCVTKTLVPPPAPPAPPATPQYTYNTNFNTRTVIADSPGTPGGCKANPAYITVPVYSVWSASGPTWLTPAEYDAACAALALYIPADDLTGCVANPLYQPIPCKLIPGDPPTLVARADYDPRPYVKIPTYNTVSADNSAFHFECVKENPAKDLRRYYLEEYIFSEGDWGGVSSYWSTYWPNRPFPKRLVPPEIEPKPDAYAAIPTLHVTFTTIPDSFEPGGGGSYANEPKSADGKIAPPKSLPAVGKGSFEYVAQQSILHAKVIDPNPAYVPGSTNPPTMLHPIGQQWQYAVILIRDWVEIYRGSILEKYPDPADPEGKRMLQVYFGREGTDYYNTSGAKVRNTSVELLDWKDIDVDNPMNTFKWTMDPIYDETLPYPVYVSSSGRVRWYAAEDTGYHHNDKWYIYLRCMNTNTLYPIPTRQNVGIEGSQYFWVRLFCSGHFQGGSTLGELTRVSTGPVISSYPKYARGRYQVLNHPSPIDKTLWAFDPEDGRYKIRVPLCITGYSFYKITVADIIRSNIDVFTLRVARNSEVEANMLCWRVDDPVPGTSTSDPYYSVNLRLVSASLATIIDSGENRKLRIIYAGAEPLYSLQVSDYTVDTVTEYNAETKQNEERRVVKYGEETYPAWVTQGADAKYTSTANCVAFMSGEERNTVITVGIFLLLYDFIASITTTDRLALVSKFNKTLFNDIFYSYTISPPETDNERQAVSISHDRTGKAITTFNYNARTSKIEAIVDDYDESAWTWVSTTPDSTYATLYNRKENVLQVVLKSATEFALDFKRTFVYAKGGLMTPASIVQQQGMEVTLTDGYGKIDLSQNVLVDPTEVSFVNATRPLDHTDSLIIYVAVNNSAVLYVVPRGIISRNRDAITWDTQNNNVVYFYYNGAHHTLTIDMRPYAKIALRYLTRDIRSGTTKEVYARDVADSYMFIKQFWSGTIDVENYWWIDKNHVLELSTYNMTLYRKTDKIDDWNGDVWEIEKQCPRSYFIDTYDGYYSVSSAWGEGSVPVFFKLRPYTSVDGRTSGISCIYINPLAATFDDEMAFTIVNIPVVHVQLDNALDPDAGICSYVKLDIMGLITSSKISATKIGGTLILGIAYNRGLCQWAIRIVGASFSPVLVGYGHVGVDGSLTGGQIPHHEDLQTDKIIGPNGFKAIVKPLSSLPPEAADIMNSSLPDACYGTETSVWFVFSRLIGIVSHYTYSGGTFTPVSLPLNNNEASQYHDLSFASTHLTHILPQQLGLMNFFQDNAFLEAITTVLTPNLLIYAPKYVQMAYINHSLGQYAYVWRNSAQNVGANHTLDNEAEYDVSDEKTTAVATSSSGASINDELSGSIKADKDISFAKSTERRSFATGNNGIDIWVQIILKSIGPLTDRAVDAAVNRAVNQTTSGEDTGRSFSQFFADNVASTVASTLVTGGFIISIKSTLSKVYTLNMFYNINDKVQCFAGPGFVNHNLVGQCVAQSITDTQVDMRRIAFFAIFADISIMIAKLKLEGMRWVYKVLSDYGATGIGAGASGSNPGVTLPTGLILATGIQAGLGAMTALIVTHEVAVDAIPKLAQTIGGYPTGQSFPDGSLFKKDVLAEGTHVYGNKPMSFFWPAFGITSNIKYTNEGVATALRYDYQEVELGGRDPAHIWDNNNWSEDRNSGIAATASGKLWSVQVVCRGTHDDVSAPDNMAVVEGVKSFLPTANFKNEQIGVDAPVFGPPPMHDYKINHSTWNLGYTAGGGHIISMMCSDTKIIDGEPSNLVITDSFCGVAAPYIAMEIKNVFNERYLRPIAITPNTIALNLDKVNVVHDAKAYHAFDGTGNRIIQWTGGTGLDKAFTYQQYMFQVNDTFKRSNIWPPAQFQGIFNGPPTIATVSGSNNEYTANLIQSFGQQQGLENNIPGEYKSLRRYSIPVHTEILSTLPATVRTLGPYKLNTIEGVTSLTTDIRITQGRYKAPTSVDFNINGDAYRATEEYVCSVVAKSGALAIQDVAVSAGLTFIGATTREAFFYSEATRMYYSFSGGREITKRDILNRFKNIKAGRWDFVNQEVMFKALFTGSLVADPITILRMDGQVLGEVYPPPQTVYNDRSDFKLFGIASGTVYQGPKRFVVSRFITLDSMFDEIRLNKKRWGKLNRESFFIERDYGWKYEDFVSTFTPVDAVCGWTHNPFRLATAMLGIDESLDCKFEWSLTFAWTEQMDKLFDENEFVTVNLAAETVSEGGTLLSDVTHVYLFKECFTRAGSAGYYTFKFQSNNGIGNRERLYVWSDGIIALEELKLHCKNITAARTQPLHTQVDVKDLVEL